MLDTSGTIVLIIALLLIFGLIGLAVYFIGFKSNKGNAMEERIGRGV